MFLIDRIKQLRLKCRVLSKPYTSSLQSNTNRDFNDDINNKMAALIEYHDQIEKILKIANKKYSKATIKELSYATRYQNALKELDHLRQENIILEEYISEIKSHNEMIEKIKQENDCLHLIYKKNISTIFRLKKEILNSSELLYNKPPLFIDLDDDDLLGFDSVIVSKSETKIDPQNETYQSLYYKIQKDSADVQHAFNSLFSVMNQTNLSFETTIKHLDLVSSQTMHNVKVAKEQFFRILQNDQDVINELTKTRYFLEQQKLNSACRVNILETDIKSLGSRVKIKRIPYHTNDKYSNWYLNKLSIKKLFRIWSKMIKITEWTHNLKEIDS